MFASVSHPHLDRVCRSRPTGGHPSRGAPQPVSQHYLSPRFPFRRLISTRGCLSLPDQAFVQRLTGVDNTVWKRLSVCPSVCPSVCLSVCSLSPQPQPPPRIPRSVACPSVCPPHRPQSVHVYIQPHSVIAILPPNTSTDNPYSQYAIKNC